MDMRLNSSDFFRSRKGNFATLFAIASVPLFAGVGMMIDYTNLVRKQSHLQNAVDSAVLYAATEHKRTNKLPNKNKVNRFLKSNFEGPINKVVLELRDDEIYLSARTRTKGLFLDRLNKNRFMQVADATAPIGIDGAPMEIVLVLDTTGSMDTNNRINDLQDIAKDFVQDLYAGLPAGVPGDFLKMGIVPFNTYVNVGLGNRYQPWIDVPADKSRERCVPERPVISRDNCRMVDHIVDGVPQQYETCDYTYGPEEMVCSTIVDTWSGCVGSRQKPLNMVDGSYSKPVHGLLNTECGTPITELTTSTSTLIKGIDALETTGNTYIAHGVMWGLRTLSPQRPFSKGASFGPDTKKVMIVMTDGDNTVAPNDHPTLFMAHHLEDRVLSDANTLTACEEAHRNGITIYTISFGTDVSSTSKTMLQQCAGSASRFFDARNAGKLKDAFENILADLNAIKLTS